MQTGDIYNPIIFSDLDGTLLDHDTYQFDPAVKALAFLKKNHIPLVPASSKTLEEMVKIREELDNPHPFIAENGSVIAVPLNYFSFEKDLAEKGFEPLDNLMVWCPGGKRKDILKTIHHIRKKYHFSFTGFSDMTTSELIRITGLTSSAAVKANQRLSTEPVLWQDTQGQWKKFCAILYETGLAWTQGGRFISISQPFDKKDGVELLSALYNKQSSGLKQTCIGFGDSPNDQAMLNRMDIAVIVKSGKSDQIELDLPTRIIRTDLKGPYGWQQAMDLIFNNTANT